MNIERNIYQINLHVVKLPIFVTLNCLFLDGVIYTPLIEGEIVTRIYYEAISINTLLKDCRESEIRLTFIFNNGIFSH